MNTLTGTSKNIKKLIISLLVMFVIISGSVCAKTSETKIIIKDINQNNEVISGFEYKIYDKNNNEIAVEKIDSSTSIVSLPYGMYTLKEVRTAEAVPPYLPKTDSACGFKIMTKITYCGFSTGKNPTKEAKY